ncbi:hypothetical protein JCM16303_002367 [Sporobolomyces ruberrimus]
MILLPWSKRTLTLSRCPSSCPSARSSVLVSGLPSPPSSLVSTSLQLPDSDHTQSSPSTSSPEATHSAPSSSISSVQSKESPRDSSADLAGDVPIPSSPTSPAPAVDQARADALGISLEQYSTIPPPFRDIDEVFSKKKTEKLPPHRSYDLRLNLKDDAHPPFGPMYILSSKELEILHEWIQDSLRKGHIRPSESPAASPILFAKKKDGSLRLCVDYRALNDLTIKNCAPLPRIEQLLDATHQAKVFSKIDLRSAYNLLCVAKGDEWLTAFRTPFGLYETLVMPFGLTNAPPVFQTFITDVLRRHIGPNGYVVVYLDDILVYSANAEIHEVHLREVLKDLLAAELYAKIDKCEFFESEVDFLGYLVGADSLRMDPSKLSTISDWPTPTNVKQVQQFLGFANFYRRFVAQYAKHARHLSAITHKDAKFDIGPSSPAFASFRALKEALLSAPVLRSFNASRQITLITDASQYALAGQLCQPDNDGVLHPVAFHSRQFTPPEMNYQTYDQEMLAIVDSLAAFRASIAATSFSLPPSELLAELKAAWKEDEELKDAFERSLPGFTRQGDLIIFDNLLFVPEALRPRIVSECHDSPAAGHRGYASTYDLLHRNYSFPGIHRFVRLFCSSCDACQRNKTPRHAPYGHLESLAVPTRPWEVIGMDHIVKLPKSSGFDTILVFVDHLTSFTHLVPARTTDTADVLAQQFLDNIFRLHGLPAKVVSDRGSTFVSQFLRRLFELLKIKSSPSTSYHPATNGATKRTNQEIASYLRNFVSYHQNDWHSLLSLAEFTLNNSRSSSRDVSPFFANYGFHPAHSLTVARSTSVPAAELRVETLERTWNELKNQLKYSKEQMSKYYNSHRSAVPPEFVPGNLVWLLRRNIPTLRPSDKLDHRRLGPFKIVENVGKLAYRLKLPPHFSIHPVFHVSLLERYVPPSSIPGRPPLPPPHSDDVLFDPKNPAYAEVDSVLDCMVKNNRFWYLLRWRNKPSSEDSWRPLNQLPHAFASVLVAFHKRYPRYRRPPQLDFSPVVRASPQPPSSSSGPAPASTTLYTPTHRPTTVPIPYGSRPHRNVDFHRSVATASRTTASGRTTRAPV